MLNARRMRAAVIPRGLAASVLAALALIGITVTAAAASHPADSPFGHAVTCRNGIGVPVALAPGPARRLHHQRRTVLHRGRMTPRRQGAVAANQPC